MTDSPALRLPGTNAYYRVIREGMAKHVTYEKGKPQKPVEYAYVVLGERVEKGKHD